MLHGPAQQDLKGRDGQRLTREKRFKTAREQLIVGVGEQLPVQVSAHNSLPPPGPQAHGAALLALKRHRLENTHHNPYTHSSAHPGTAGGETPPAIK